jgi:hypothetical protein
MEGRGTIVPLCTQHGAAEGDRGPRCGPLRQRTTVGHRARPQGGLATFRDSICRLRFTVECASQSAGLSVLSLPLDQVPACGSLRVGNSAILLDGWDWLCHSIASDPVPHVASGEVLRSVVEPAKPNHTSPPPPPICATHSPFAQPFPFGAGSDRDWVTQALGDERRARNQSGLKTGKKRFLRMNDCSGAE